jgi:hypothetical protein
MGVRRSNADLFIGFGWPLSIGLVLQAVLLWQPGSQAEREPGLAKAVLAPFAVANIATVGAAVFMLLPLHALGALAMLASLGLAWIRAGKPA